MEQGTKVWHMQQASQSIATLLSSQSEAHRIGIGDIRGSGTGVTRTFPLIQKWWSCCMGGNDENF